MFVYWFHLVASIPRSKIICLWVSSTDSILATCKEPIAHWPPWYVMDTAATCFCPARAFQMDQTGIGSARLGSCLVMFSRHFPGNRLTIVWKAGGQSQTWGHALLGFCLWAHCPAWNPLSFREPCQHWVGRLKKVLTLLTNYKIASKTWYVSWIFMVWQALGPVR